MRSLAPLFGGESGVGRPKKALEGVREGFLDGEKNGVAWDREVPLRTKLEEKGRLEDGETRREHP
jgi:hypothetical protein